MPADSASWHREVLPHGWERAAALLDERGALQNFYLAGGTGLALHIGHRRSVDFDLFSGVEFDVAALRDRLVGSADLKIRQTQPGTLHIELTGILVSFLHYPYPLLFALDHFHPLAIADPRDIACMKVNAIAARGTRRDFVDLYVIAQTHGLREILSWFEKKYVRAPYNRVHVLKALTYFADAEQQPMPQMLVPLEWEGVRRFFVTEVPNLPRWA